MDDDDERDLWLVNGVRSLRIGDCQTDPDGYLVKYMVELNGEGLHAAAQVIDDPTASLANFLSQLAEDFRGWAGTRTWESLERQLSVAAEHGTGGHVRLIFSVRSSWNRDGWEASLPLVVEAGSEMQGLAHVFATLIGNAVMRDV